MSKTYAEKWAELANSPEVSFWLKQAIKGLQDRDPLDALADAEILYKMQMQRWEKIKNNIKK